MDAVIEEENATSPPDLCVVVAIYDDHTTRARTLAACDYLLKQSWENVELDFRWWRTDFLSDPLLGEAAARDAIASDILILCSLEVAEISPTLEAWFESWIGRREGWEGALIDLDVPEFASSEVPVRQNVLRDIARRGNFDYLTTVPGTSARNVLKQSGFPSATVPTSIVDHFNDSRPPSHHGLNE
jgi:hypothetical protein